MADYNDDYGAELSAYGDHAKAYGDFVRAVGEHKLNAAQAELALAVANGENARTYALSIFIQQMQEDFIQVSQANAALQVRINAINKKARYAQHLLSGVPLADYYGCVAAYRHFEIEAKLAGPTELFAPLDTTVPITGEDFLYGRIIHNTVTQCYDPDKHSLLNALTLIQWSFNHKYIARSGSNAQLVFIKLFQSIAEVARQRTARIALYMERLRSNVYSQWHVEDLPVSAAEKRILDNTSGVFMNH